jgi:hypothetical protein
MDLHVPVAVGSDTYVDADFLFVGPNGLRVTYGVKIFNNGARGALFGLLYDTPDNVFFINCPLDTDTHYLTKASTSGSSVGGMATLPVVNRSGSVRYRAQTVGRKVPCAGEINRSEPIRFLAGASERRIPLLPRAG